MTVDESFGARVKQARRSAGVSREQLASASLLSLSAVRMIENGESQPRRTSVAVILRALADLGVAPEDLR